MKVPLLVVGWVLILIGPKLHIPLSVILGALSLTIAAVAK